MPTLSIEHQTDVERLLLEQAIAYTTGLHRLALAAPDGTVLAACEDRALTAGRHLVRAAALQARADSRRWLLTGVGLVCRTRGYVAAAVGGFRRAVLGVDGSVTAAAERRAVVARVRDTFARAESALHELCGWDLDDGIRRLAHAAVRAAATRPDRDDGGRFDRASGHGEVLIDAGQVNTDTGWRDVKLAVFCKRAAGEPGARADWDTRAVPPPAARTVVVAIERADTFAGRRPTGRG